MQKINIDIFMGQSADIAVSNKLPCGITSYNPYIIWKIPDEIKQLRFAIKITNILDNSLLATFKSVTSISSYQIPLGNGLNNRWTGLCFIQVLISDNLESDVFQYTSGDVTQNPNGYFVIDSNIQTVSYEKPINYTWQKSIDENTEQTLLYHLQVANHPNFNNNSLIIDQQGIQSQSLTMITYEGFQLPIGNYFFKVRTFDGYDFSQWSTVNCFRVRQFQPPILKNLTYTITDNQTGDIIVEFDIQNKISDYTAVVLTYAYANNLQVQYPCILQETTHRVPNGHNSLTWQTVKNSKYSAAQLKLMGIQKINILQDVDLFLYAFPYYNGLYGDTVYTLISLKNQKYDVNTSSVGSVNENYIIRAKFSSPISHHKYYGWDSQYYQQILKNEIYTDKNYTDNYIYYKQLLSLPKKKENVVYNILTTYLGELPVYVNYIGWNSERYKYIVQNKQILVSEKNTFDSKYYTEYLIRINASDKYCQENYKGFKIKNNRYFHTLYVDGRTYRNNDKHSYTIKQPVSGQHDAFDFSAALGMGGDDDSRKVVTIPSYLKDTSFAPQFPGEAKLPFQGGEDRNGKDFKFKAETINWRNVGPDGDWKVKGYDKEGNIYYVDFWSAPLVAETQSGNVDTGEKGQQAGKDQNLDKIISGEIEYQKFFDDTSKYGAATYPDGKVIFQDEQKSPQYTMYPDYYTKEGYPVGISEKYWDNIKTQDMYIRKYKIVKGGSQAYPPYGHKDFKTQPSKGIYHCYFTNKSIPQLLIKSKNLLISTDGRVYYKKQNIQTDDFYPSSTQYKYIKINDLYKDLPYILYMQGDFLKYGQVLDAKCKICQQSGKITCNYCNGQGVINGWQTCLKCNGEKKIKCPQCNGVQGSKSDRQSLYFLTYNRVAVGKRGQPQKYVFDEEKGEYKKPQTIFANIAVPQYIKSNKGVYSANGFNGKQSAFALGLQLKRDSRRYVLGRHYKWENKLKNIKVLDYLNKFKQEYYPDFQDLIKNQNVIIGFNYKWAQEVNNEDGGGGSNLYQLKSQKYIYVPTFTNGDIRYAWFEDDSYVDWSSVDNDDYIFMHREINAPNFNCQIKKRYMYQLQQEGTKFYEYFLTDQRYLSDKSKYGILSFQVQGQLSDWVVEQSQQMTINQFLQKNRIIYLNHKTVIKQSVVVFYKDQYGLKRNVYNYSLYQGNNSYNAYIVLTQKRQYYLKQFTVKYEYYVYERHQLINEISNDIIFYKYDDVVLLPVNNLIEDNQFEFYCLTENNEKQMINKQSYSYQFLNDKTQLKLNYNYKDVQFFISYNYKEINNYGTQIFDLNDLTNNDNIEIQNNKYVLNNIHSDIIQDSIYLYCYDQSQRYHKIENFSKQNNLLVVDNTVQQYIQQMLKPIKIKYKYDQQIIVSFTDKFSSFNALLKSYYVNLDDIKVYFLLENKIERNITHWFQFISDGKVVNSDTQRNVYIHIKTTKREQLLEILNNVVYVSYSGFTETPYFDAPYIYNQAFKTQSQAYDFYITYDGKELQKSDYTIDGGQGKLFLTLASYQDALDYINNSISVTYKKTQIHDCELNFEDKNIVFDSIEQQYQLQHSDIEQFNVYYLNEDRYVLQLIQNTQQKQYYKFELLQSGKSVFSWLTDDFLNKKIYFIYSWKDYLNLRKTQLQINLKDLNETYDLNRNRINRTFQIAKNISIEEFQINSLNFSVDLKEDINSRNFDLYYELNGQKVYLTEKQYTISYGKLYLKDQLLLNIKLYCRFYDKLSSQDYKIQKNQLSIVNDQYLNEKLVVIYYTYLSINMQYHNNGVLSQLTNKIELKSSDCNGIDHNLFYDIQMFYGDDYCQLVADDINDGYVYEEDQNQIVINKNIDNINKKIILDYDIYDSGNGKYKNEQIIKFNSANSIVKLQKSFVYNVNFYYFEYETIKNEYGDQESSAIKKNVPDIDYILDSKETSTIRLSNYYLNKKLYIKYNYYLYGKDQVNLLYNEKMLAFVHDDRKQLVFDEQTASYKIDVSYTFDIQQVDGQFVVKPHAVYFKFNYQNYEIQQLDGKYYILINDQNNVFLNSMLKIQYEYKTIEYRDDNYNLRYLMFSDVDRNFMLQHSNTQNLQLNVYMQDGYVLMPNSNLIITRSDKENDVVYLKNELSTEKYLNKKFVVNYNTKYKQSFQKNFKNDGGLFFYDKDSYIVLSNYFISKENFFVYCETLEGLIELTTDDYILDCGEKGFRGVLVLNQEANYKRFLNNRIVVVYKYIQDPKKIYNSDNQKFPNLDYRYSLHVRAGDEKYISGYPVSQHEGYSDRQQPVYPQDQGITYHTNIKQYSDFGDYQFLYLQSSWDAYNTLHISGAIDKGTRIILQYAVYGTSEKDDQSWKDCICVGSTFDQQLNHYLIPAMTYDMFLDTFDDSVFENGVIYRFRMQVRGSAASSSVSLQWVYSIPFIIDHDAVNPCNITNIQFNAWTKMLTLEFRIDDTQGDLYDVTELYYTKDGNNWNKVDLHDVRGNLNYLQSNKRDAKNLILHKIYWNTNPYRLDASYNYRIKIVANYTKYNQGDTPNFSWEISLNPLLDYYNRQIFILQGGKQYYIYKKETLKLIENQDGTVYYQELQTPVESWQPAKSMVDMVDQNGNYILDQFGNKMQQQVNYIVVQGEIQQLQNRLNKIKNKPYKIVFQNGVNQTIPWGYRQYFDQTMTNCIDYVGYLNWLQQLDTQYQQKRGDLIQALNKNIQSKITLLQEYKNKIWELQLLNRRELIKQGYYPNGFFNFLDTPFLYKLYVMPTTQNEKKYMQAQGYLKYQVKYQFQLDFNQTFDSQFNDKPLRSCFSCYRNGIMQDILGMAQQNMQNSLYQGYFSLDKDTFPGKQKTDININDSDDFTNKYYWRVRPYTQITNVEKREKPQINITDVKKLGNNIIITFCLWGTENLGSMSFYNETPYQKPKKYYIFCQEKREDKSFQLYSTYKDIIQGQFYDDETRTKIVFDTDIPRRQDGSYYLYDDFKDFVSVTSKRQRPSVLKKQNVYYMFYDKNNSLLQNIPFLSLSEDGNYFGEYSQLYPFLPKQSFVNNTNFKFFRNVSAIEKDSVLYVFGYADYNNLKGIGVIIAQKNYDYWAQPKFITALQGCNYPSIIKTAMKIPVKNPSNESSTEQYQYRDVYVMLCQKNDEFVFFYSYNLNNWNTFKNIKNGEKLDLNLSVENIKVKDIVLQDLQYSQEEYYYISPYLFLENNTNNVYLYFTVYFKNGDMKIYRSLFDGQWQIAEKVVDNAFNPCVINDYYNGQLTHRLYYNKKEKDIYDRTKCDVCICHNCNNTGYVQCYYCQGSGLQYNDYICWNCQGSGKMKCTECDGDLVTGYIQCPNCNGVGCEECDTNGKKKCPKCQGNKFLYLNYDYTIHNVFVADFKNIKYVTNQNYEDYPTYEVDPKTKFNKVEIKKVVSTQKKSCSLDNILAGAYQLCKECKGTGKIKQQQCAYCKGNGIINGLQYQVQFDAVQLSKDFSNYNFFLKLNLNYSYKTVKKFGQWFDVNAQQISKQKRYPTPNYRYLDI